MIYEFEFNSFPAVVIVPDNANGKWIWKTEFLYAFDEAERALLQEGYTRVYYQISNMYGSPRSIELMEKFHAYVTDRFFLDNKAILFGFSRGGLYAFNFALSHPDKVAKIYLDAPVLDMRSWPREGTVQREEVYREYGISKESIAVFGGHPVENFEAFFAHGIPVLLIAGDADEVVPLAENSGKMIDFCVAHGIALEYYIKPGCAHHPHSLTDVTPILNFINN